MEYHEFSEEENVSPLIRQIQKLEERICELEENYRGLFHDISSLEKIIKS